MTPEELSAAIRACLTGAVDAGELSLPTGAVPQAVKVERPRNRDHGDWATSVALQLSKPAGVPPRKVAEVLAARLSDVAGVKSVDVAGPGFVNVVLDAAAAGELARTVVEAGAAFGRTEALAGRKVNLEFVSANPTGPVHLGGTRWAAVGDSLARVLEAVGADVTREYYFNDHGAQIDRFARSLLARALGQDAPEDGYGGAYIEEIATRITADARAAGEPDPAGLPEAEALEAFRSRGVALMFDEVKQSLHDFRVDFDVYFHEDSLHSSGAVGTVVQQLKDSGRLFESDGAWWLRSTEFGDDKDRVVIKSDGNPAYVAGDLAYLRDKRARGFDLCIYLLGADHHGYVARLKAAAAAFGDDPAVVEVLIGQMVNLVKDGVPVRMSKRAGTVVTMEDLVEAVGVDAARYALVRSSVDSQIDVDLDLLTKRTNDNPVFYVQYAHARTSGVSRNARDLGVRTEDGFDPAVLDHATESTLLAAIGDFPRVVAQAAELREPHRVARYLESLAGSYHKWYDERRVTPMGEEAVTDVHRTRLWLNDATRTVLANGLALLGVSAPERM
ncbi:arginyl-tRNA synthetase [Quadrisphaera granulorum]|uniref:Arginine--tRNA ligase n=1 Tax=Quadrisphaera granulorum TaxID=317664 RepID=A0A316AB67_9ACTN|nr:arginine--tRNA ligase [Quadrisphaera granulorum]PWJ54881.1 arginyl-tRNA synthetase [Quadrisphaera granulorum]SZE95827.1 arginyl-tRNA synthetase [Quadrisphaera granulorum]